MKNSKLRILMILFPITHGILSVENKKHRKG